MYESLHCISLRTIRYDDRKNIVTAWSAERGRVSLLVPAGASREARRRRALMMPLSLFEGEADVRPGRELLSVRDVRPSAVLSDLSCEPAKAVVAMFLAEVLEKVLREAAPDAVLTTYLFHAVQELDAMPTAVGVANFPLVFLYKLGEFLGIAPDSGSWQPGRVFDMEGGTFRATRPLTGHWLEPEQASIAEMLSRMDFKNAAHMPIPRAVRRVMLEKILEYYGMHYTSLSDLKSLPVVSEIF